MNWDIIEGRWKQASGAIRTKWSKLTDNDLKAIGGKRDQLVGKIQELYGTAKDEVEREIDSFTDEHLSAKPSGGRSTNPRF